MWIKIEKDRKTLSVYSYIAALLMFFMLLRMDPIKDIILCRVFKICYKERYRGKTKFSVESRMLQQQQQINKYNILSRLRKYNNLVGHSNNVASIHTYNSVSLLKNFSYDVFLRRWKKKILIYSLARSGSSFLGEIFNRRKDVFYVYEPLHTLSMFAKAGMFPTFEYTFKAPEVLHDLLRCKFDKYEDHFKFMSFPELCNPHFRLMSKVLSSPPFCKKYMTSNSSEHEYRENCYTLSPELMETFCMQKKNIVIKELVHRLPLQSINGILPLFKDSLFRTVCLVRDPRAVISSMRNIGGIGYRGNSFASSLENASDKVCKILLSHYRSLSITDLVIRSKLVAVRYEDIVSQPEDVIRALFAFVNMDIDEETVQWVIENTHGRLDNTDDSFSIFLRNVSYSLNSWRRSLSFDQIAMIQSKCGSVMRKFGYVLYSSEEEVLNLTQPTFNSNFQIDNVIRVM